MFTEVKITQAQRKRKTGNLNREIGKIKNKLNGNNRSEKYNT